MTQNNMLMELLKLQQSKTLNEVTSALDFNKTILVFNGLSIGCLAFNWLQTVNSVANFHR